jgi:hypothetical protein
MAKVSVAKTDSLDRFVQAMSRVLGISRKRLDKILLQRTVSPSPRRTSDVRRTR